MKRLLLFAKEFVNYFFIVIKKIQKNGFFNLNIFNLVFRFILNYPGH